MLKTVLLIIQVLFSLGIITTVLLQSGRSAGLSGVIAGGAQTFFSKKKGVDQLLNKISAVLAAGFLIFTLIIAIMS